MGKLDERRTERVPYSQLGAGKILDAASHLYVFHLLCLVDRRVQRLGLNLHGEFGFL